MRRVTCQCGQSFAPFLINGVPRTACPYCKCKLTVGSDGSLAGTVPTPPPPSQRVSELQPAVLPPQPPPARYACEISAPIDPQAQVSAVYNQSPSDPVATNVWRDRHRIVVLGHWATFPPVCVFTGRTDNVLMIPRTVTFLRHWWLWFLFFGLIGVAIAQAQFGTSVRLDIPVCGKWLARKRLHFLIGVWIALISGLLFLGGSVAFVANWREKSDYLMIPMLLTTVTGFAGLLYMAIAGSLRWLGCNRMEGNCMWLTGASPDFLKHLPDWSTTGPRGAPGVVYRNT